MLHLREIGQINTFKAGLCFSSWWRSIILPFIRKEADLTHRHAGTKTIRRQAPMPEGITGSRKQSTAFSSIVTRQMSVLTIK
jgi:hypothetical protein